MYLLSDKRGGYQELLPHLDKRIDADGDDSACGKRKHDAEKQLEQRTSVNHRRLLYLLRDIHEIGGKQDDRYRDLDGNVRQYQRPARANEAHSGTHQIQRNQDNHDGEHLAHLKELHESLASLELKPCKRERCHRGNRRREKHGHKRDNHAVHQICSDMVLSEGLYVVREIKPLGKEPDRNLEYLKEVLEGREDDPIEREDDQHEQEYREHNAGDLHSH